MKTKNQMLKEYFESQLTEEQKESIKIKEYVEQNVSCPNDGGDLIEIDDEIFICSKCGKYWGYYNNKIYDASKPI